MSENPWHKRYHSDALTGYMDLTLEQRGAYTTILDLLYDRGEPIKDNERLMAGYLNISLRKYRTIRDSLIDAGKIFFNEEGNISNKRFEKEREKTLKTSRKRAENAKRGGEKSGEIRKKANNNNRARKQALQQNRTYTRSQKPDSSVDKSTGAKSADVKLEPDEEFEKKLFDFGKEILGPNAGGVIAKIKKARGAVGAMDILEQARKKQDPMEWCIACLKARDGTPEDRWIAHCAEQNGGDKSRPQEVWDAAERGEGWAVQQRKRIWAQMRAH